MTRSIVFHRRFPFAAVCLAGALLPAQAWLPPSTFPGWGATPPATIVSIVYDPLQTSTANGSRLHTAIGALVPGQGLAIGPGTWSIPNRIDLNGVGSAMAPIWLFAADPSQRPVITRPDALQNALNMGSNAPARHWVLRDLEITGGSDLLRLYDCAHVWIDRCFLHDGGGVGIAANTTNTDHLWITRNEIARPGPGTNGEAMYLGGNYGSVICSWSVIAFNHVHDTRAAVAGQGDGIELKQGSHHDWIVGNFVHGCRNPCILLYGTGGNGENVVERNLCFDSDDVVLQVQGDAIVRNNIVLANGAGFGSHDHQGPSANLQFVHNTVVSWQRAVHLQAWNGRPGMVFANNVVYSLAAESIWFGNGSAGVQVAGNVVVGPVNNLGGGYVQGTGLADFEDLAPGTWHWNATPRVGSAIDNRGSALFAAATDFASAARALPVDPGAVTNRTTLQSPVAAISMATGGTQPLAFEAPAFAGATYLVVGSLSGATPGIPFGPFTVPLNPDGWLSTTLVHANSGALQNTAGQLDALGRAGAALLLPPLPAALQGLQVDHSLLVLHNGMPAFVSNPVALVLQ